MTAGVSDPMPARSDSPDFVDGGLDDADIAPDAVPGKPEVPHLRGLKADKARLAKAAFQRLLTALREKPRGLHWNPPLSIPPHGTMAAEQPILTMAEQELPFDRYWSKG
jgi:hypothetical protein